MIPASAAPFPVALTPADLAILAGALAGLFVWRPLGGVAVGIAGGLLVSALTDSSTMARVRTKLPYNNAGATSDGPGLAVGGLNQPFLPLLPRSTRP